MNMSFWLPLLVPMTSLSAGIAIFFLREKSHAIRSFISLFAAVLKTVLVGLLMSGVSNGQVYEFQVPLFLGFDIVLKADSLSLLFVSLSAILWLFTIIYAIGYFKGRSNQSRFFGFFSLCVSATTGIALSGNLFTLLIFYEFLTLTTYPLVVHKGTQESLKAGRVYLTYTLLGGIAIFFAMVWLSSLVGAVDFTDRGILASLAAQYHPHLIAIFFLLIIGFGVKAAIVPLHGWLPMAMVAPAPVSALLHAVAVVKAGSFGIIRVVYDIYGVEFAQQLGVLKWLGAMAIITIIYGSLRALVQDDLKRRLAYSTISQVSYITLGVAIMGGPTAAVGAVVHLVHQGVMKITLFFCAGNLAEGMNISRISQMKGIARRMPLTMATFTIAALGMIGIPPLAGFISKWYLGIGALQAQQPWIVFVLLLSSVLNAAYFLPIIYAAWFMEPEEASLKEFNPRWKKNHKYLQIPPLVTAGLTVLMGLLASMPFSPLSWAKLIVLREFGE
ncbi:Na(+) H(+) antiporter subunit A [hydrothermal vent metagenome]|uniref:Na(+) H(+) antiporter subunit A n=1 Tax=hydrothermal vent metagenome TaxID=652676 RepID=A0A3B1E5K6_9ZZZZ